MHNSLKHQITPAHLRPFVPTRTRSVGVRFELGQIAPEPVPPMGYAPLPNGEYFDPTRRPAAPTLAMVCVDVARGPGCGITFYPKRTTAMRCALCKDVRWHGPPPVRTTPLATRPEPDTPRQRAKRYAASPAAKRRQAA